VHDPDNTSLPEGEVSEPGLGRCSSRI